jgi:hypothetical protein
LRRQDATLTLNSSRKRSVKVCSQRCSTSYRGRARRLWVSLVFSEHIGSGPSVEQVDSSLPVQLVVSISATETVVSPAAAQGVVVDSPNQLVLAAAPVERVISRIANSAWLPRQVPEGIYGLTKFGKGDLLGQIFLLTLNIMALLRKVGWKIGWLLCPRSFEISNCTLVFGGWRMNDQN